jgi:hypothetical protein
VPELAAIDTARPLDLDGHAVAHDRRVAADANTDVADGLEAVISEATAGDRVQVVGPRQGPSARGDEFVVGGMEVGGDRAIPRDERPQSGALEMG